MIATTTGHIIDVVPGEAGDRDEPGERAWRPLTLSRGQALLLRSTLADAGSIDITVDWRAEGAAASMPLIGSVRFFDGSGAPIPTPYAGFKSSPQNPAFHLFPVGSPRAAAVTALTVTPPPLARRLEIRWRAEEGRDGAVIASAPRIEKTRVPAPRPTAPTATESSARPPTPVVPPAKPARQRLSPVGWVRQGPMSVAPGAVLVWRARIEDQLRPEVKAAVASLSLFDASGRPLRIEVAGVSHSPRYANFFYARSLLPETAGWFIKAFQVPDGVVSLQLDLFVEAGSPTLCVIESELTALNLESVSAMVRSWPPSRAWIDPAIHVAEAADRPGLADELHRLLDQTQSTSKDLATPGWPGPTRVPVSAGATLIWRSRMEDQAHGSAKAAMLTLKSFDASGLPVVAPIEGLSHSPRVANYVDVLSYGRDGTDWFFKSVVIPEGVAEVELDLRRQSASSSAQLVDWSAVVLAPESAAEMLACWQPDDTWIEPAIKIAGAQGDKRLVRRLVDVRERLRYDGLSRPQGWTRPENLHVAPDDVIIWRARLEDASGASAKAAVMSVLAYDADGFPVATKWPELSRSQRFPNYLYVPAFEAEEQGWQFKSMVVQPDVAEIGIELHVHDGSPALLCARAADLTVLTLESMALMVDAWEPHEGWLEPALRMAQAEGAVSLQARLAELLVHRQVGKPEATKLWRAVHAELEELEPDWYPRIDARVRLPVSSRLTVCHLHKTAYPFENTGGAIRCLNTLKSQLEEGLDPFVITPPGYPAYEGVVDGNLLPREKIEGCEHFRIGPNTNGIRTLSPPARVQIGAVQAAAIVARRGAHLVHAASGVRGYELALQAFALRDVFDIPVIYEVRSFHEHTWAPAGPRVFGMERTQLRIRKENYCMSLADHVVTISESMRRILVERGVPEEKIDVIPNGIDAENFREVPSPVRIAALEGAELVVGYVSNMSKREGHRHLIEAVARLRQGGLDCRCLFVGSGPERKALDDLVQQLDLGEFVHFAGEVDHQEIKAYYMAIDVFAVPRIPDYAADWVTPLKPYEAMALSRPLVVTDLPALREVVGDGERGLIAEPADSASLAEAIRRYADDPALREQTSQRARRWVFEHRTWKANAKRYREIYERVIARHGAARQAMRSRHASAG